jgi:hypothetical protein
VALVKAHKSGQHPYPRRSFANLTCMLANVPLIICRSRTPFAQLSHSLRPAFAQPSPSFRTASAHLSHSFRTAFAQRSHSVRTAFAPLSHRFRTFSARLSPSFAQSDSIMHTRDSVVLPCRSHNCSSADCDCVEYFAQFSHTYTHTYTHTRTHTHTHTHTHIHTHTPTFAQIHADPAHLSLLPYAHQGRLCVERTPVGVFQEESKGTPHHRTMDRVHARLVELRLPK